MKILIQNPELVPVQKEWKQNGASPVKGGHTFSTFLERASSAGETQPSPAACHIFRPAEPCFTMNQQMAIESAGRALDLLDNMENGLIKDEEGSVMIGDISSLLGEEVERLKLHRDGLDPGDPLREHLDAIGALAHAESMKVKRGDYTA